MCGMHDLNLLIYCIDCRICGRGLDHQETEYATDGICDDCLINNLELDATLRQLRGARRGAQKSAEVRAENAAWKCAEIIRLRDCGCTVEQIMSLVGRGRRTVETVLRNERLARSRR